MSATIDLERLAREAGFRTGNFHYGGEPFVQAVSSTTFRVELHKFAALVLEEAAKTWIYPDPIDMETKDYCAQNVADDLRALAASLRPNTQHTGQSNAK